MRGSIIVRPGKTGTTYAAVYRDGTGRQRWTTFSTRRAAESFLNAEVVERDADRSGLARGTAGEAWLDAFLDDLEDRRARGAVKPSTVSAYRSVIAKHVRPTFGPYRSDRITHRTVGTWLSGLAELLRQEKIAVKTHNNILALWSALIAWSRHPSRRYVVADLAGHLERAKGARRERLFLEPAVLKDLLALAEGPAAVALHLAAYAGLRRGELTGLQVGDLDADQRRLHVRRAVSGGRVLTPKTKTSLRSVDITPTTVALLERVTKGQPADAWLFPRADGEPGPMHPDSLDDLVVPVFEAAGTPARLHTLRHTYASLLINQGEEAKYVSAQLGHASIQITLDTYGHLFRQTRDTAMARLDLHQQLTPAQPTPPPSRRRLRLVR